MRVVYKKSRKYKLPSSGNTFNLVKDVDELEDGTLFYVMSIYKSGSDVMTMYSEVGYHLLPSTIPSSLLKQGEQYNLDTIISTQQLNLKVPNKVLSTDKKPRAGRITIGGHYITVQEYKAEHVPIKVVCSDCRVEGVVHGNNAFQKLLYQVPGSKNKFYACSTSCMKSYKEKVSRVNGSTSKLTRQRFHKAVYKGVYGYVYGVYNKVEKKWYIGKVARSPFARWEEHMMKNKKLNGFRFEDVSFHVLHTTMVSGDSDNDIGDLWEQELFFINKYNSLKNGYNIQKPSRYISREQIDAEDVMPEHLFETMFGKSIEEFKEEVVNEWYV